MLRGMANQRTPSATDVEKSLARPQPQLAADHIELVALRGGQVVAPVFEKGTAVDHLRIEKERIERVGKIVMKLNVLFVGGLAAVGTCPVAANGLERPWPAARHEQELCRSRERLAFVEPLDQCPG